MSDSTTAEERIVMTPVLKEMNHTVLRMERSKVVKVSDGMHEAGGDHKGIVINKNLDNREGNGEGGTNGNDSPMDDELVNQEVPICLSFKVFLVNGQTNQHSEEWRQLRFLFRPSCPPVDNLTIAQCFFRDVVNPIDFPANYVGYIMRIMKLMQTKYPTIVRLEVEMKQVTQLAQLPSRPCSNEENGIGGKAEVTEQKVLELVESCYPNAISLRDLADVSGCLVEQMHFHIQELMCKQLVKSMEGPNGHMLYTRVTENDTQIKVVKQMPKVARAQQPTIAIITAQFAEKQAVDAMITNRETYVRFQTQGEGNVYTLGNIGPHRVVSTKLPCVGGSTRDSLIASGNSTTRLLGTFQHVEYVLLVGVGGGVPHFTDYNKHVRLGDIVVSSVTPDDGHKKPFMYLHGEQRCDRTLIEAMSSLDSFNLRTWCPQDHELTQVARDIFHQETEDTESDRSWEQFIKEGINQLSGQESDFNRPNAESDKLFMSIGHKDVIEVGHPLPPTGPNGSVMYDARACGYPVIHFGPIASGQVIVKDEVLRQEVATTYGIKCFDCEFDSVLESIFGNRKDKYCIIRGISDYKDGLRGKKDWIPYASVAAAAFMKALILNLPLPHQDSN